MCCNHGSPTDGLTDGASPVGAAGLQMVGPDDPPIGYRVVGAMVKMTAIIAGGYSEGMTGTSTEPYPATVDWKNSVLMNAPSEDVVRNQRLVRGWGWRTAHAVQDAVSKQ